MPLGTIRAMTLLHRTFRRHPAAQRLHILGRFLSAPFLRTLDAIPEDARVLDIGAGHGLLARLAVEERAREVVAVDPDLRKVLSAYKDGRVRFVAGYDDCIRGLFDAVTVYDVLYRLSSTERDALFARVYERLKPGGLFIVKDLDPEAPIKARWNRMQERLADLLHMTVGAYAENDTRDEIAARMSRAGFVDFQWKRVDFGYPHAHVLYQSRRL